MFYRTAGYTRQRAQQIAQSAPYRIAGLCSREPDLIDRSEMKTAMEKFELHGYEAKIIVEVTSIK